MWRFHASPLYPNFASPDNPVVSIIFTLHPSSFPEGWLRKIKPMEQQENKELQLLVSKYLSELMTTFWVAFRLYPLMLLNDSLSSHLDICWAGTFYPQLWVPGRQKPITGFVHIKDCLCAVFVSISFAEPPLILSLSWSAPLSTQRCPSITRHGWNAIIWGEGWGLASPVASGGGGGGTDTTRG